MHIHGHTTCRSLHTLACTHSHMHHYPGEVKLQASMAGAEPMRAWGARPQIRRQRGYLEIHHPVRHKGHHHRQELHQHLEVGHVFLWRRTPLVRPLIRQQVGTLRVPVIHRKRREKKDSHNSALDSTKATISTSTILLPGSPLRASEMTQLRKAFAFNLSFVPRAHTMGGENQFPGP